MRPFARAAAFAGACFILLSLPASPALAQGPGGLANGVCREDVEKLCSEARGVRGAVPTCLRSHLAELDPDCKLELEGRDARLRERLDIADAACPDELKNFCADQPDYEKIPCLRKRHGQLSEGCRAVIPAPKAE